MKKWSQQKRKIATLTKQGVNVWLAYVLAQPVDIDLAVVAFLIIDYFGIINYFGISSSNSEKKDSSYFFSVSGEEKEESFEKAIA